MISTAGAGLIAQVIPVLVLIVAVEARALGAVVAGPSWSGPSRRMRWKIMVTVVAVALTVVTEWTCIWSVSSGQALVPLLAFFVTIGLVAIGSVCFFTVLNLTIVTFVGRERWLSEEQAKERSRVIRDRAVRVRKLASSKRRVLLRRR